RQSQLSLDGVATQDAVAFPLQTWQKSRFLHQPAAQRGGEAIDGRHLAPWILLLLHGRWRVGDDLLRRGAVEERNRVGNRLAEDRGGDAAAVDRTRRLIQQHETEDLRILPGGEPDEGADVFPGTIPPFLGNVLLRRRGLARGL